VVFSIWSPPGVHMESVGEGKVHNWVDHYLLQLFTLICFRSSGTLMILRVNTRGCTSILSFKKQWIACGSRTDVTKESSLTPSLKACPFQQLHFSWLQYVFFLFFTQYITQLAHLDWSRYWWVADWNEDHCFLLCWWILEILLFTSKLSEGFCRL